MSVPKDPFAVIRIKEYSYFTIGRFFMVLGIRMQAVIVGWQVFDITQDELSLGLIGLAEALPFICTSLFGGHLADVVNRKKIITISIFTLACCSLFLLWFTFKENHILKMYGTTPIYAVIGITGIVRAFIGPSFFAFLSQLVPRELLPNATIWNTTVWHTADILGPMLGGLLVGYYSLTTAYVIDTSFIFVSILFILFIKSKPVPLKEKKESLVESLGSGLKFVFHHKLVLASLSLDLFAVLFGGAVAMLPAFAKELGQDAQGFGLMRAAPAIGAVIMAIIMAYKPPMKNAGRNLFISVIAFGVFTILFAFSRNIYLSLFFLALTGAFDNISVVIRSVILQLQTPENMRGRVSSVSSIFIGSSNEIGAFESGAAARLMGLVPSVVFGGLMTIIVVAITDKLAPQLRKLKME